MNYQYRKKPVVIEAILSIHVMEHMAGAGTTIPQWAYDAVDSGKIITDVANSALKIETLEGVMTAKIDDFIIRGVKGEIYPCKPDIFAETYDVVEEVFEAAYQPTDGLSFGHALVAIKSGLRVARDGWNGKGMFIFLVDGSFFKVSTSGSILGEFNDVDYQSHIDMKTADGTIVPWIASQSDMLADDWMIVDIDTP